MIPGPLWRAMSMRDLVAVSRLDEACQPHPWGPANFQGELLRGDAGFARVLESDTGELRAYICTWAVLDELHVGNVGVHPGSRRHGFARSMMLEAHRWGGAKGCTLAHLEVRAGNTPAITLYEGLGYRRVGLRRGYYADNGEDALLLVADL